MKHRSHFARDIFMAVSFKIRIAKQTEMCYD